MSYVDDAVTALVGWEGRVNWMYLDTTGNVTVGVGQLLATPDDALLYPFLRSTAQIASREDIVEQYGEIKAMPVGHAALAYRRFDSLLLPDRDIDWMTRMAVARRVTELAEGLTDFDSYPTPAKLGLIDMAYNVGVAGLHAGFPSFWRAVKEQRWDAAAAQCHRVQPSAARNEWTREQFFQAAAIGKENIA